MDCNAHWSRTSSKPAFDLSGAFPSSSSHHANGQLPNFNLGSSSSLRGLSRPRMAKHRKKGVVSATASVKDPILAGVGVVKQENGASPFSGLGRDLSGFAFGEGARGKNGSFQSTSSSSRGGFVFGAGSAKGFGLKFDGGTSFGSGARLRSCNGLRPTVSVSVRRSINDKKNRTFSWNRNVGLNEEMEKLNIGKSVDEVGVEKSKESGRDDRNGSNTSEPECFVTGSINGEPVCHDGLGSTVGVAGWFPNHESGDTKEKLSIFGNIWTKNSFSAPDKTDTLDESAKKLPDCAANSAPNHQHTGVNSDRNPPPRINRKNAYLFSDIGGRFGKSGIPCDSNCVGAENSFCKESSSLKSDDSTMDDDHFWKFKFRAVKEDGNLGARQVDSTKPSCDMSSAYTNAYTNRSSTNPGCDTYFCSQQGNVASKFDFQLPKGYPSPENKFSMMRQTSSSDKNNGVYKVARQRKKMERLRRPSTTHHKPSKTCISSTSNVPHGKLDENPLGSYSPMEFSPFQEAPCSPQSSKATIEEETSSFSEPGLADAVPTHPVSTKNSDSSCFSHVKQDNNDSPAFRFSSNVDGFNKSNFTFVSSSSPCTFSKSKCLWRKKRQKKPQNGQQFSKVDKKLTLPSLSVDLSKVTSCSQELDLKINGQQEVSIGLASKKGEQLEEKEALEVKKENILLAAIKACKEWQFRGEKAYADGDFSEAEEYYTHGLKCISPDESSRSCMHALMLCYSHRAAARMHMGKIKEALDDYMVAISNDPSFFTAQIRAADCHLALGETEDAMKIYRSFLQSGDGMIIDVELMKEASAGLLKSQQVADCIRRSSELLQGKAYDDVRSALEMISNALLVSPHSEELIKMKAEALMKLRRYEEVINLCENTLASAECNSFPLTLHLSKSGDSRAMWTSSRIWRCNLICKSYFYMGRFEEAINFLGKYKIVHSNVESCGDESLKPFWSLAITMHELLQMKAAGNDAFQSGKYVEAVECYTASLSYNIGSRPFSAICFCNRAAGYQALGQLIDAIADCNLALALNANYSKALSRRAASHELIRNYGQASTDIRRLISILEMASSDVTVSSAKSVEISNNLRRARSKLSTVEEECRKHTPLDFYKILGLETSCSASDVKKSYRKAALKHHPDKALQLLVRSEGSDDVLWNDLAEEVRRDADSLFKMVGEAYAVLSDPAKRKEYDVEEKMRASFKEIRSGSNTNSSRNGTDVHKQSSKDYWRSYEKSDGRQHHYTRFARYYYRT